MKGSSCPRPRKTSPAPPAKLKLLCVLPGGGENRLVSVDRRGGVGLGKLYARLAGFIPPGFAFSLQYELPLLTAAAPLAGDDDVARMVAAHDRLAAEQGKCPRIRIYLLDVAPISPTTVLERGEVLGDLNERNHKRCSNSCHISGGMAFAKEKLPSCGMCGSPPPVNYDGRLFFRRKNGILDSGNVLPWSYLASGGQPNKRQFSNGFAAASHAGAGKYENGGTWSRGIGFEALRPHVRARRRSGGSKIVHAKAYQQQSLLRPTNDTMQRAMVLDSNSRVFYPMPTLQLNRDAESVPSPLSTSCIKMLGMDSEATTEKPEADTKLNDIVIDSICSIKSKVNISSDNGNKSGLSQPLSSLLGQVSLEAEEERSHIKKDGGAGNKADVINSLDVCSKEVVEATYIIPAVYSVLASQELQTIQNSDLEELRELGSGRYGTVFYGKWRGSDVAIKRLRSSCFSAGDLGEEKMVADFWKEARLLGQLHHPNVVAFYGVVSDGPVTNFAIVTEYMVNGSLKQVLKRKDRTIDRRKRLIIAMDAAFGMEYLHEKNVVHFDLKSHNFFVNMRDPQRPICKIGDLGLSKVKQRTLVSGGIRGTVPWMAPELFSSTNNMVTEKVDVYSFGIVMWELLTGEEPYENMRTEEILAGIIKGDLRPVVPSWCDPVWRSLMERCWSSDPDSRPPFSEIAKELRTIMASMNIK